MTREERRRIYEALSAPFPEEAIERTDGRVTGKGYSTVGLKAQFVINRLNEVVGLGGWRVHRTVSVRQVTTAKGRPAFEAVCDVTLELGEWVDGQFVCWAESLADGGHVAMNEADARKGALSSALKRSLGYMGCGRQAYEGTIDEDNVPGPEVGEAPRQIRRERSAPSNAPAGQERTPPAEVAGARSSAQHNGSAPASHGQSTRNRLTSKQSSAIWSMVARLKYDKTDFRRRTREKYGCQPEFISRQQASELISILAGQLGGEPLRTVNGNGSAQEHAPEPGR